MLLTGGYAQAQQAVGPPEPPPKQTLGNSVAAPYNGAKNGLKKAWGKIFSNNTSPVETTSDTTNMVDKKGRKILSPDPYNNIPKQTAPEPVKATAPATGPAHSPLLTPNASPDLKISAPEMAPEVSSKPKPTMTLDNPGNPLGFGDAQNKLNNATALVNQKNYLAARNVLIPLKQWLIDATEAHINLYKSLDNVSTARAQAELEKQVALQFALMRDQSIYQLARIEVAEHNMRAAIKDLTDVVKSQPRSDIGIKAYQLLQDIGFTEKLQLAQ